MINLFKLELKRAFINKNFIISIFLTLLIIFISLSEVLIFREQYSLVEAWMRGIAMGNGITILFIPILVSFPYSTSLTLEKNNNYLYNIFSRVDSKHYIYSKCMANMIISGLSISIPAMILLIIVSILFKSTQILGIPTGAITNDPFSFIIEYNNVVYLLIQCLWVFFQGAIWGTFSFAVSLISKKVVSVIMIPFIYYIAANFLFAIIGLELLTPPSAFAPYLVNNTTIITIFFQPIVIIIIILCIYKFYMRNRDELYI